MRPTTDLQRKVAPFEVISDYSPRGDQPRRSTSSSGAIRAGEQDVVLLGATGTGKSATTAWLIERVQRPDPGDGAQQDAGGPAGQRVPRAAAQQRGRVLRLLLRLLPARGLRPADGHLHREGLARSTTRSSGCGTRRPTRLLTRRDVDRRGVSVSCIYGLGTPQEYVDRMVRLKVGEDVGPRQAAAPVRRHAVHAQRPGVHSRHVPGARRHDRDLPGLRGARRPDRDVRRRDRAADDAAPADRRDRHRGPRAVRLPGDALRRRAGAHGAGHRRHRGGAGGAAGRAGAAGQAARGAAAAHAHDLRHRDDAPGRLLLRASRTTRGTSTVAPRARRPTRCSTTSPRTSCSSSTSRT